VSFLYLIPAMAFLIAWIWLGEVPTLLSAVGGVIALAGILIVNTSGRRR
jgi:drug/metabolite transporter (DMT)-like permease